MPTPFTGTWPRRVALALATALMLPLAAEQARADSLGFDTRDWQLSIGRPVPLTEGERAELRFLVPGIETAAIAPEQNGRLRAIIHSDRSDSAKRQRIKWLID